MNPVYPFVSYMVYYPIVLALFILNFFADVPPKSFDYPPTNVSINMSHLSILICIEFCLLDPRPSFLFSFCFFN